MCRLRVWFGLRQLCDVKDEADAQVELSQNSPQLRDQVKLHDLAQQRVIPGRMSLELKMERGETEREKVRETLTAFKPLNLM